MKVIFPNSAWVTAYERFVLKDGRWAKINFKVRYAIIIHPVYGPVFVDSGYTPETTSASNRSFMLRLYAGILKPDLIEEQQPYAVLKSLGFAVEDVKRVIITHFHADHISGLKQFPNAQFITNDSAFRYLQRASPLSNYKHGVFTELFPEDFSNRMIGISTLAKTTAMDNELAAIDLLGDESILAVDLPGHAIGHFGVLINGSTKPIFYAVDAQWHLGAVLENRTPGWPANLITDNYAAWQQSTHHVMEFANHGHEVVLCHHPDDSSYDMEVG